MSNLINVETASTKELVAFYNAHAHELGKKEVKKFADRATAQLRVSQILGDLEVMETGSGIDIEQEEEFSWNTGEPSTLSVCLGLTKVQLPEVTADCDVYGLEDHDLTHCPECGIHLSNGVGVHNQEVNGKKIKHNKFEYCCLACTAEFGPAIRKSVSKTSEPTGEVREAMKTSLKLDRTIAAYDETGKVLGTWVNACRMWKQNLDWMTSAQQDGLTAKLYKAAKQGEKIRVVINGRGFELVTV